MNKYDFSKATTVDSGFFLIPEIPSELQVFPDIYDRFCSVIYMMAMVGDKPNKSSICQRAKDTACVRAALSDFVGIEEYLKSAYPKLEAHTYRIYKLKNPMFHMLKILRNYNVHISTSKLGDKGISGYVGSTDAGTFAFEQSTIFISNLSVDEISRLHSAAKDYSRNQLEELVEYFEVQQHEYGLDSLIMRATLDYAIQIQLALSMAKP
jgi:hypothetical protein